MDKGTFFNVFKYIAIMVVLCACIWGAGKLLAVSVSGNESQPQKDNITIVKELPPGYELEINQFGEYRPTQNGKEVFWIQGQGTKEQAIDRAWGQYQFDKKEKQYKWELVGDAR